MTWDALRLSRLPVGAKLMVTLFLLIVGPGYLFATANIFFKHKNADGKPEMTLDDLRATFHGIPEPDPSKDTANSTTPEEAASANEPQESADDPPAESDAAPTEVPAVAAVNSEMLEQVRPGGEMLEHLEEGGEPAIRGLIAWLEGQAKEEDFDKASLVQEGDPSAKNIIAAYCVSCHNADGGDNEDLPYADTEDSEPQYELVYVSAEPEVTPEQPEPEAVAPPAGEPTDDAEPEVVAKKPEPKMIGPTSTKRLIHITHAHILAIPVFTFVVGALFMFTGFGPGMKLLLGPLPMLAVLLDIGGWWAARCCEPFIYVIAGAGALFGITYALQILCILCSVWCGRKDDPAVAS
jgi:hypothetical protein